MSFILTALVLLSSWNAQPAPIATVKNTQITQTERGNSMKTAIQTYATGADKKDVKALEGVFHEHFQVVALTAEGIRKLDKKTYLDLLSAGKIGGVERQLEIVSTEENGKVGSARVRLHGPKTIFHDHLTLIKEQDQWQLVSNVTWVEPK